MTPIILQEAEEAALKPYCAHNVTGLPKFTPRVLVDKINALPDTANEKALLVHYWGRLSAACITGNAEAVAGWLVAIALATHTAAFLLPLAAGKIKQEKTIKRVRSKGTAATMAAAERRQYALDVAVKAHPKWKPKQFGGMADELGLSEEVIIKKVRAIQRQMKNG